VLISKRMGLVHLRRRPIGEAQAAGRGDQRFRLAGGLIARRQQPPCRIDGPPVQRVESSGIEAVGRDPDRGATTGNEPDMVMPTAASIAEKGQRFIDLAQ
jgi:hypothetical protein